MSSVFDDSLPCLTRTPDGRKDLVDLAFSAPSFKTPALVVDAIREAAEGGAFAPTRVSREYLEAAGGWQQQRHSWSVEADSAVFVPRTTQLIAALVNVGPRFYEKVKDVSSGIPAPDPMTAMEMGAPLEMVASLAQQQSARIAETVTADNGVERPAVVVALSPTYGRIAKLVRASGAELRLVRMEDFGGRLRINWPALENAMIGADYLLWTNPHNPTGRVWSEEELKRVGYLAEVYRTTVISDDIHADFNRPNHPYTPMAKACPFLFEAGRLLQLSSPMITFSMSGLGAAVAFAKGELKTTVEAVRDRMSLGAADFFAVPAAVAAWTHGGPWATQMAAYVDENQRIAAEFLRDRLPRATVADPDGTALLWADVSAYAADDAAVSELASRANVMVTPGGQFGSSWSGWVRLGTALPRDLMLEGLGRFAHALDS